MVMSCLYRFTLTLLEAIITYKVGYRLTTEIYRIDQFHRRRGFAGIVSIVDFSESSRATALLNTTPFGRYNALTGDDAITGEQAMTLSRWDGL